MLLQCYFDSNRYIYLIQSGVYENLWDLITSSAVCILLDGYRPTIKIMYIKLIHRHTCMDNCFLPASLFISTEEECECGSVVIAGAFWDLILITVVHTLEYTGTIERSTSQDKMTKYSCSWSLRGHLNYYKMRGLKGVGWKVISRMFQTYLFRK